MKKKDTQEAKEFWALAEETSKSVEQWPQWKLQFAAGYQRTEPSVGRSTAEVDATKKKS